MAAALWTMIGEPPATVQLDNFVTKHAFALQGVLIHVALAVDHPMIPLYMDWNHPQGHLSVRCWFG